MEPAACPEQREHTIVRFRMPLVFVAATIQHAMAAGRLEEGNPLRPWRL
jgi:hypothetical protein